MDTNSLNAFSRKSHSSQGLNAHCDLVHGSPCQQKRDDEGMPPMMSRFLAEADGIDARIRRDQEDNREERMRSYVDGWEREWEKISATNTKSSKSSST